MGIVKGTNSGFCESAPGADPAEFASKSVRQHCLGQRDTSSATATTITEIGWWCNKAHNSVNFEVGIYTHDVGNNEPQTVVGSLSTGNSSDGAEDWQSVTGLNISIDDETIYWICIQVDNTAQSIGCDYDFGGSSGDGFGEVNGNQTALPNPTWDIGFDTFDDDNLIAIYAVWEEGEAPPEPVGTGVNVDDTFKEITAITVQVDEAWKEVTAATVQVDEAWKTIF